MNPKKLLLGSLVFFLFIAAKEIAVTDYLNLPAIPYEYNVTLPAYFTNSANPDDNTPATNPITNNGATLGRVLFYDKNLSLNRTVSCASCHKATEGFSDSRVLGVGFAGGTTGRHGMTLINARYYNNGRFFWDERAATLEAQVLLPLQDATEMGLTAAQISERVAAQPYYNQLFINAFGDNAVTNDRVSKALAQFVRSIVSYQSKYDIGRASVANRNNPFPNFTAQENQGKQLFLAPINIVNGVNVGGGGCAGCHNGEAFISVRPENNGLDATSTTDLGVGGVAPIRPNLIGAFKNSSIRNIELTAPYMHDGRFATLEQVVEHYNSGIQAHPNLSPPLRVNPNGPVIPVTLNFNATQKSALVAFLKTLTDNSTATEARWSNPFCQTNLSFTGTINAGTFQSSNEISVQNGSTTQIQSGNEVNFISGKSIILNPTFEVKAGSVFKAQIGGCN
jgi:cytochrome c peroxidase